MASLPSIRRFYSEDYPNAPVWFQNFIRTLNLFADPIYTAVNQNLTFQQNFASQVYTFTLTAGATADKNSIQFTSSLANRTTGLLVMACNVSNNLTTPIVNAVTLSWYTSGKNVFITAISGLTSGTTYTLTVLSF